MNPPNADAGDDVAARQAQPQRYHGKYFNHQIKPAAAQPAQSSPTAPPSACMICFDSDAVWQHTLDPTCNHYVLNGRRKTLGSAWTLCDRCEALYRSRRFLDLITIMQDTPVWMCRSTEIRDDNLRQALATFRSSDTGFPDRAQ